jgi:xanthine dehydrogenase accessory factor
VLDALRGRGVDEAEIARVRSPAGLDLGPSTQPEIAVAILAELVAWRHLGTAREAAAERLDPVCGMTVALGDATETAVHEGVEYAFCSAHCRHSFESDPTRFVQASI